MSIHFKFKSAKAYDTITFPGTMIRLFEVKKAIVEKKKLGKGLDFDLIITDAQSGTEYVDDNQQLAKNTSVTVKRVPARGEGILAKLQAEAALKASTAEPTVNLQETLPQAGTNYFQAAAEGQEVEKEETEQTLEEELEALQSQTEGMMMARDNRMGNKTWTASGGSNANKVTNYYGSGSSSASKSNAMSASTTQRVGAGAGAGRGGGHFQQSQSSYHSSRAMMPNVPPPPDYVCFRCGEAGHYIHYCPTNGDPNYEKHRVKKKTGIPKSFMKAVSDPSQLKEGSGTVVNAPWGGLALVETQDKNFSQLVVKAGGAATLDQLRLEPPKHLACLLCKCLLNDAVLIPCCQESACDECLRHALIDNRMECPLCRTPNMTPEKLLPNKMLRVSVDEFMRRARTEQKEREELVKKVEEATLAKKVADSVKLEKVGADATLDLAKSGGGEATGSMKKEKEDEDEFGGDVFEQTAAATTPSTFTKLVTPTTLRGEEVIGRLKETAKLDAQLSGDSTVILSPRLEPALEKELLTSDSSAPPQDSSSLGTSTSIGEKLMQPQQAQQQPQQQDHPAPQELQARSNEDAARRNKIESPPPAPSSSSPSTPPPPSLYPPHGSTWYQAPPPPGHPAWFAPPWGYPPFPMEGRGGRGGRGGSGRGAGYFAPPPGYFGPPPGHPDYYGRGGPPMPWLDGYGRPLRPSETAYPSGGGGGGGRDGPNSQQQPSHHRRDHRGRSGSPPSRSMEHTSRHHRRSNKRRSSRSPSLHKSRRLELDGRRGATSRGTDEGRDRDPSRVERSRTEGEEPRREMPLPRSRSPSPQRRSSQKRSRSKSAAEKDRTGHRQRSRSPSRPHLGRSHRDASHSDQSRKSPVPVRRSSSRDDSRRKDRPVSLDKKESSESSSHHRRASKSSSTGSKSHRSSETRESRKSKKRDSPRNHDRHKDDLDSLNRHRPSLKRTPSESTTVNDTKSVTPNGFLLDNVSAPAIPLDFLSSGMDAGDVVMHEPSPKSSRGGKDEEDVKRTEASSKSSKRKRRSSERPSVRNDDDRSHRGGKDETDHSRRGKERECNEGGKSVGERKHDSGSKERVRRSREDIHRQRTVDVDDNSKSGHSRHSRSSKPPRDVSRKHDDHAGNSSSKRSVLDRLGPRMMK